MEQRVFPLPKKKTPTKKRTPKQKKQNISKEKTNTIPKYFKNVAPPKPKKSNPKTLSKKKLLELISILYDLNNLDEIVKLHKVIRKLNKIQTNQILFALRLINKSSLAPTAMLKNALFNYITGQIKIIR